MNITIFGGTGKTGQLLVRESLARGHTVTAVARNPGKSTFDDPNLTVVHAELDDVEAIEAAIDGSDAVLSVLGPTGRTKGQPLTQAVDNIIRGMDHR